MSTALKVLIVEDNPDDAELAVRELRRGGHEPSYLRVETEEGLVAALRSGPWDLVISDHSLPGFSGLRALDLVRRHDPDMPFIVVAGTIGEMAAIEEMKAGANDYVMKGNLTRLPAAVGRELREVEVRRGQRRAEQAFRDSEQRYRALVEASPEAILVNQGGRIVLVNSACLRLFGAHSPEEILGRSPLEFLHPDFHAAVRGRIRFMLESGKAMPTIEARIIRQDGKVVEVDVTAAPFSDSGSTAIQGILHDISARKRAERELKEALRKAEESDRLKHAFLANMSHEIRTPLNVITGYASLLAEGLSASESQDYVPMLAGIESASRRLIATIHAVLDLSRIETGAFEVRPAEVRVGPLVRREAEPARALAEKKNLAFACEIEEPDATIRCDEYCLSHAVANLLDNAVKFTAKGKIAVRLFRAAEGPLCLEIRDSGVGIDPAYMPRMFKPFSQEEVGYTRRFEGPGLGLRLAWRFLEINGARLDVESTKGEGSVFRVWFSREVEEQEALRGNHAGGAGRSELHLASPPPAPATARVKPAILVVEDDPGSQTLMQLALFKQYEVLLAASAEEARGHLRDRRAAIHAVLMDISLRGPEDGLALTRDLRRDAATRHLPIIVTTAHALHEDRKMAIEAGCDAYLTKPFQWKELLALVERFVPPRPIPVA